MNTRPDLSEADLGASLSAAAPSPAPRVLLVEDHPFNRLSVQILLEPLGVDLVMAENGAEGLRAFQDGRFDLVLMDIQMPVMDGLAATAAIRAFERERNLPRVLIVTLTGNVSADHQRAASEAGADAHLSKPVDPDQLWRLFDIATPMESAPATPT